MPPRLREDSVCRWHECHGCEGGVDLRDVESALLALREHKPDAGAMDDLRRVALRFDDERLMVRYTDEEVCAWIASLLAGGRLRVCGERVRVYRDEAVVKPQAPPDPKPAKRWVEPPPPAPPPPPEESTFSSAVDPAALAKVMKDAARLGLPFCEECEKARATRDRSPAPAL